MFQAVRRGIHLRRTFSSQTKAGRARSPTLKVISAVYSTGLAYIGWSYFGEEAQVRITRTAIHVGSSVLSLVERVPGLSLSRERDFDFVARSTRTNIAACDSAPESPRENLTAEDFFSILGTRVLLKADGSQVPVSALVNKSVALYFSAHWCSPCRRFTPLLAQIYLTLERHRAGKDGSSDIEFVFISSDNDEADFEAYRKEMPWLVVPFTAAEQRQEPLRSFFGARGIPWLVTINPDGTVANPNAVGHAIRDPTGRSFPWEQ
mmetsp:Transcript_46872/g.94549  ORF Transcript_46872/g.94549 Transcript_46872/m.94549 type:complete len:263 (-) Transcript_46872:145-933(-)